MTINLTSIIEAVLALIAALISYRLIPWLKTKTTVNQQKILRSTVKTLVFAAEEVYGAGHGAEKLEHVKRALESRGFEVDTDQIKAVVAEYLHCSQ